jgi:hypothetical protein
MVPKDRRGLVGGLIQGAFPIGFAAVSLVSTITLSITSQAQYCDWGWCVQPCAGEVRRSGPADGRQHPARSHVRGDVPVARRPMQSKGT